MPSDVRDELHHQLAPYRRVHPHVRWTRPETWHLTLLFLGPVAPDRLEELRRLVNDVGAGVEPYRVTVDVGGGRSRREEGVAWLGLSEGAGALIDVATSTAAHCPPDITDGPPPKRTPSAHLTIVRKADPTVIQTLRDRSLGPLGIGWKVDRIQLVRSYLEPDGARYETLHECTL